MLFSEYIPIVSLSINWLILGETVLSVTDCSFIYNLDECVYLQCPA